ncbi:MAG: excinuclease ABC subunit UvrA [Planctomycetes bacterium]|nr:excinuclease ABC subunit UvrA [Planctomycetota bacterium]
MIRVRGVRVHNLKNLDLDIPRDQLVVITGPSGSGKSSLAFDTLYAEGQRQFLETLSVYARQYLHQLERPDLESVEGLPPTICIDQRQGAQNPRSTVATVTEVYDYLRLLFARLGSVSCYQCGAPVKQQTAEQIEARLMKLPEGTKTMILAPMVRGRKGEHRDVLAQIRKAGLLRARVNGEVLELDQISPLSAKKTHHIDAVVDRIIIRAGIESRVGESVRLAIRHGQGLVAACYLLPEAERAATNGGELLWRDELFSTRYACPNCEISYEELEPRTFSFNSPYGACPVCEGLGSRVEFDPDLVIPDKTRTMADGAIAPWRAQKAAAVRQALADVETFLQSQSLSPATPVGEWPPEDLQRLFHGDNKKYIGLLMALEREYATATDARRKEELETYRGPVSCTACEGSRLRKEATSVNIAGKAIHQLTRMSVREAREFLEELRWEGPESAIGEPLIGQMTRRLCFLERVGVDYLTLDRSADTLSGGELQRVRLATSIGSGLVGVCYILDEPSIGLHPRDNQRLFDALRDLQRMGNSVLIVEHDEAMIRQADHLIDVGPAAGESGGLIVAQGAPAEVQAQENSITGRYLSGREWIPIPATRRRVAKTRSLMLEGVATNNLKRIDVMIPLGVLVCVTGVSGSGKSSLINETLIPAVVRRLGGLGSKPGPFQSLRGVNQLDKVIPIDQSAIGRSPRSNPATYSGLFDEIRKVFASAREAKLLGFRASRFSFNAKGGRCEHCQGQGTEKIEMHFLPDLYVACPACGGARFNPQTLQVRYRGKSIADVLSMSVQDAIGFFENFPVIVRGLQALGDVGLGYLRLGQASNTLSGGEAQRIKLATELARTETGNTLYVFDEPTTGLHVDDVRRLLAVFSRLVDKGNSVIVIEHHLDVIKSADWLIDLGPEGGTAGGYLLASGTPEEIAALRENSTGLFLRKTLQDPAAGGAMGPLAG